MPDGCGRSPQTLERRAIRTGATCMSRPSGGLRTIIPLLALLLAASGCRTSDALRRSYLERSAELLEEPRRPVVVIPGFGVSMLYDPVAGEYVWGTPRNAIRTAYDDDLDLPVEEGEFARDRLVARGFTGSRGPINSTWHLGNALRRYGRYRAADASGGNSESAAVHLFAWDWRASFAENARALDVEIDRILARYDRETEVDLVTHSAGGVLALTYLRIGSAGLDAPGMWDAAASTAARKIGSVVMIAPPVHGSSEALRVFVQRERFIRRTFPPEVVATWPSVTELLPFDGDFLVDVEGAGTGHDLHRAAAWRALRIGPFSRGARDRVIASGGEAAWESLDRAFEAALGRSRRFREAMERPLPQEVSVTVLAGDCVPTARRVLLRGDGSFVFYRSRLRGDEIPLARLMFEPGDGTVVAASARVEGATTQLFCSGHQGLAMDPAVQRAVIRALTRKAVD
jgi:hypothetical protein